RPGDPFGGPALMPCRRAAAAYLAQAAANFGKTCARPVFPTRIAVSWLLVVDVSIMSERLPQSARPFTKLADTMPRADEISSGGLLALAEATTRSAVESRPAARVTSLSETGVRRLPGRLRVSA